MLFNFNSPTNIYFGQGYFEKTSEITKNIGSNPMIVCGRNSMRKNKFIEKISSNFKKAKKKFFIYENISPDAKSNEINDAITIVKKNKNDFIIGLGGGSAIDAAKAIAVGTTYSKVEDIIGKTINVSNEHLPIVAIPTTSGTGSEVSKGSIITDIKKNFKSGIRGNSLFPKIAIIDPIFSLTMPSELVAETGFDAFTHLFESYLAKKSNPITEKLSEEGISLIIKYLPQSLKKKDLLIKEKICYAALIGGINVANASTCLPHRLQQAMGSVKEVSHPHARGLACVYPSWLKEEYKFSAKKINLLKKKLNIQSAKYEFILNFMNKIKVNNRLKDYGIDNNHIEIFIKNISGNLENDPINKINNSLIKKIYQNSI
ncbi:iron-containing alcohol dehydrogenase [Pelagibacterales bacterium SAG-MED09]|nr:iron-containing alcohol dehydrogenase [Pelagibacterales bacterium SAG-MED09]